MGRLRLDIASEALRLAEPFRISGYVFETVEVVVATLRDGEHRGRGEASGVFYLGDEAPQIVVALDAARGAIEAGPSREELRAILPPGGARNAIDCAMWELEAARAGQPVWQLAGLAEPTPLRTTFTLGADNPAAMAERARRYVQALSIKVKLTGELDLDIERLRAIREARPDVWLGVDGNQGFTIDQLDRLIAVLQETKVSLLEQPLARGREADLDGFGSPVPIVATRASSRSPISRLRSGGSTWSTSSSTSAADLPRGC